MDRRRLRQVRRPVNAREIGKVRLRARQRRGRVLQGLAELRIQETLGTPGAFPCKDSRVTRLLVIGCPSRGAENIATCPAGLARFLDDEPLRG
jgi:hypothetical protein